MSLQDRDEVLARLCRGMGLRRPQAEALTAFHMHHRELPGALGSTSHEDLIYAYQKKHSDWSFEGPGPEITFHLATGVGKTRLIGALIAYLYLSGDSQNFVIVTPRAEIVRKFIRESQSSSPKYLFHDRTIIEDPEVVFADNIDTFNAVQNRLIQGPMIWIITPQALAAKGSKLKQATDRGPSLVDYLQTLPDLVVVFDESHHLGTDRDAPSVWRREVRSLRPKYVFGTTATLAAGAKANVIYSYDLQTCLNEHLYTKQVQVIPDRRDDSMGDDEYDRVTLKFAYQQLLAKQAAIDDFVQGRTDDPPAPIKPIMLVFCEKKEHAEEVANWLRIYLDDKDAVLLVHSGLPEDVYLPKLLSVDQPSNPIRVVVNVAMLTEGWDVSNVYVIAPLRRMASSTLVTQVMGRGLRLPYGEQVGDRDVDTLDVLCFGSQTMQAICDDLIGQGYGVGPNTGIRVVPTSRDRAPITDHVPTIPYKLINVRQPSSISIPNLRLKQDPLDLSEVSIPKMDATEIQAFMIHDPRTVEKLRGRPAFHRDFFVPLVATDLIRRCNYLSHALHYASAGALVDRFVTMCGYAGADVPLEPERAAIHIKKALDEIARLRRSHYVIGLGTQTIDLTGIEIRVPASFTKVLDASSVSRTNWKKLGAKGVPITGWQRSVYEAVPFDQPNELKVAKALDRSAEVKWWFRNLPQLLRLATPAGMYAPDFAFLLDVGSVKVLLEVKGDEFQRAEDSDSSIKRSAATRWCSAMSQATGEAWEYWFLLDSDAEDCETFADVARLSDRPSSS